MDQRLSDAELEQALDECAAEPIHIPGIVQPFGVLLAFHAETESVSYVSENCADLFGVPHSDILNASASDILGHEIWHELRNIMSQESVSKQGSPVFSCTIADTPCSATTFESNGFYVVELEHAGTDAIGGAEALRSMSFLMTQIQACDQRQQFFDMAVDLVRHFTGYDRVMIYEFDPEFNGQVIAERCRSSMQSFMGMRFPHWDIPPQAREIMKNIPLRMIEDTNQVPVKLLAAHAELPPLDITLATSRGVSPVHMEYLRNMGSAATMTLNIVVEDQLWGIISLHNRSPKVPSANMREVLKNFVPIFAAKLLAIRNKDTLDRIKLLDETIVSGAGRDFRIEKLLPEIAPPILEVMEADGITTIGDTRTSSFGAQPEPGVLSALLEHSRLSENDVIAIDNITDAFPQLAASTNGCSGVLIAKVLPDSAILIFRKGITQEVAWAGKPDKPITKEDGVGRLSPRSSFSIFLENVKGRSRTWSRDEQYFIGHVRTLLHASERQTLLNTMNRQQSLMIDELNHRVRNILALVRSVSRQARRRYGSLNSYAAAMESRIHALAASHDLSAGSMIAPVPLKDLIRKEFAPFNGIDQNQVTLDGPDRNLLSIIAPIFSLVIHELATNAAKYGALSKADGRVEINLKRLPDAVEITWKEKGGPRVIKPNDIGFGTALIEKAVPHELGGTARLDFEPDGVKATLVLPDRHFDDLSEPHISQKPLPTDVENEPVLAVEGLSGSVLLLEDNYIIAKEMADQMREFGFEDVEVFANAADSLNFLDLEPVAVAILDVNLSNKMTSVPVALELQKRGVPFFFVTGYGENAALSEELKDVPLLTKPVSTREFRELLVHLLF